MELRKPFHNLLIARPEGDRGKNLQVLVADFGGREQHEESIDWKVVHCLEINGLFQDHQRGEGCLNPEDRCMRHGIAMANAGRTQTLAAKQAELDRSMSARRQLIAWVDAQVRA